MTKYIIVKYASQFFPENKAPLMAAVHPGTYTANQCGISEEYFTNRAAATIALEKLSNYNPTVDYGIVEAIEPISCSKQQKENL